MKLKRLSKYAICFFVICLILTSCNNIDYSDNTSHVDANATDLPLGVAVAQDGLSKIKYYDGCIYFIGPSFGNNVQKTLWRYNIATDICSTVCADAICMHNTKDCPFFSMEKNFYISDNCVYYERTFPFGTDRYYDFVRYDIENAKLKQYFKSEDIERPTYKYELYVDGYRFYYKSVFDQVSGEYYFALHRLELATGDEVALFLNDDQGIDLDVQLLFALDEHLYFSDGREIFSADYEMNDKKTVLSGTFLYSDIYTDGQNIYWGEGEQDAQSLYRARLDGSEKTSLGITAAKWQITSNYIYYLNTESYVVGKNSTTEMQGENIVIPSSELRRANLDGSDDTRVFELNGDICYEIISFCSVGRSIYLSYIKYYDANGDNAIEDGEIYQSIDTTDYSIMCINTQDGSVKYIRCET